MRTFENRSDLDDALTWTNFLKRIPGSKNTENVEQEVEVICFDFFDTLVYRIVEPEDTKRLASNQLGILLGEEITGNTLYLFRRRLEAELCRKNAEAGSDPEFNFLAFAPAFYACLKKDYTNFPKHFCEKDFIQRVLDIEIATEKQVQRINPGVHELLLSIDRQGIRLVLVSDFYIPKRYFKDFLDYHGLTKYFDQIFISADYGVKKSSGRLYDKILAYFQCPPEKIVMIGDNQHSDILMAQKKGIQAFSVPLSKTSTQVPSGSFKTENHFSSKEMEAEIRSIISRKGGDIFPEIGASLYRFIFLLFQSLVKAGVDHVFFFSKEGELLRVLFDQFQKERFGAKIIESHYLMVSRKSTYICSLKPLSEEGFNGIFQQYIHISPREFLLSLNFTETEASAVCREISVKYDQRIPKFHQSSQFKAFIQLKAFESLYESKRADQKRLFLKYLESFDVDFYKRGLNIIDVGWKGSIQDNLFHILQRKVKVKGYYIGLLNPTNVTTFNKKKGVLFSNHPHITPFFDVYRSNTSLFEIVLGATHGSADKYVEAPISNKSNDTIRVQLLDLPEERRLYQEKIQPIQACITSVFQEINRLASVTIKPPPDESWYAKQHARIVYRPTRRETAFFKGLYHLENFGIFEFSEFKGRGKLPIGKRWDNLKWAIQESNFISEKGIWHPVLLEKFGIGFAAPFFGERDYRKAFPDNKPGFKFTGETLFKTLSKLRVKRHTRIAFFLGIPEISGGTYVIFEHAVRLKQKGYPVFIITREDVHPDRFKWHPEASELGWLTIEQAGQMYFDIAVATWWQSAILLGQIKAATYIYFIQSIESRFFPSDENATNEDRAYRRLAESTYLLPIPIITEARWIKEYLNKGYGIEAFLVRNGIRKDLYTEVGEAHRPREKGKLRVLVEGPLGVPYKNVEKAIEIARKSDADEIWLFTSTKVDSVEGATRIFSQIPIHETPPIYRSCDVLLKLSTVEGMFGPPLEIFHCGGTAIVYNVTGHEEYIRHHVNSFVLPEGDEHGVIHHLNLLKHQPELLEHLKKGAKITASKWPDWNTASDNFEKVLMKVRDQNWPNRIYLSKASEYLIRNCENDMKIQLEENKPRQIFQLFWHFGDGFSESESWKKGYRSGEWVLFQRKIRTDSKEIHIRIDPCMQEGVVFVSQLSVYKTTPKQPLVAFNSNGGWEGVEVQGTASLIYGNWMLVFESTGNDPQIVIPAIEIDDGQDSDILVEVALKCLSHRMALREIIGVVEKNDHMRIRSEL